MGEVKAYFPVEIYSIFLQKMKESAEAYVGKAVTKAVLTIPASFNGAQRQAVRDGATLAGLDVLYLVEEPTAAAITYALAKQVLILFSLFGCLIDFITISKFIYRW